MSLLRQIEGLALIILRPGELSLPQPGHKCVLYFILTAYWAAMESMNFILQWATTAAAAAAANADVSCFYRGYT